MIFDIQRFSTHDGPGIRTVVFFKGCPLVCRWCENPESQSFDPEFLYTKAHCLSCWTCIDTENKMIQTDATDRRTPNQQGWAPFLSKDPNSGILIDRNRPAPLNLSNVCPALALQVAGREASIEEIMAEVRKDRQFYNQSGGGLTLSGGEPLAQPDFALALAQTALAEDIDIAIETSLAVSRAHVERAAQLPFHWLTDLKHVDPDILKAWTRADFPLVAGNLKYLAAHGADLTIRLPVIPGFNDDEISMRRILEFAAGLSVPLHVDLLPYHDLGASKYARLGREYTFPLGLRVEEARLQQYVEFGQSLGLAISIGG